MVATPPPLPSPAPRERGWPAFVIQELMKRRICSLSRAAGEGWGGGHAAPYSIVTCTAFDAPVCSGSRAWMRCAPGFIGQ